MKPGPAVCHVLHGLRVGGAEVLAARLARRLCDEFRFSFACLDELGTLGQQLRDEGFRVEVLGRRSGLDGRLAFRLRRLFRRERIDLVHAHQYTPFFYAAASRLPGARPPVLFTEHGRHFPDYPRRKRMLANRLLLRGRDRVVGVGRAVARALVDNEGFPPPRVEVLFNGIDLGRYENGAPGRQRARQELGAGDSDLIIIQVARLDYLKDHATSVRTLARLAPSCPEARLVLVGEGPEGEKVRQSVDQLRLGDRVRFLGLRADVPRLLRAADVFLLTSLSEGVPLAVIEAMAAGLPVVATGVGGVGEVVEEGVTGFLAPSGADDALAQAVVRLAQSPRLRSEMGERGRQRARTLFSESRMQEGYARLYREMLRP
jgi:glycosyltransferase involved in cell wall biosynthesis